MARRSDHSREELLEMTLNAAQELAEQGGLRSVTARGVARKIGYTIGTIYNLFDDLDDLIVHLNARTLDLLYETLSSVKLGKGPEKDLLALAREYMRFTGKQPRLWGLLFEHQLPEGRSLPDWYYQRIYRLYGLIEKALDPCFSPKQEKRRLHVARVLWSSIHGICSLATLDKLASTETQSKMVTTLVTNFLGGMQSAETN